MTQHHNKQQKTMRERDSKGMYVAPENRYDRANDIYRRCGQSGIMLPKVSLGLWHNFGGVDPYERSRAITHYAFDHGITHFDLANNYGPPYGSAEETMEIGRAHV